MMQDSPRGWTTSSDRKARSLWTAWVQRVVSVNMTEVQIQRRLSELTPEEGAALFWRCQGKTIGEIEVAMGVAAETVTLHLARVYQKLGLGSLTDFQRGLVLGSDLGSMLLSQP